ncbi:hypothetical protein EVAR_56308_1 [Eumeta japonica]|uniref:Ig-like domain-containing protein n=1 Tax=Eumeta variegata TaxID=151549 RepID=A0A4C1Z0H6_EUMVA|nr:hypothetical protein EVAR_56308_1 [Eumeta japonica]
MGDEDYEPQFVGPGTNATVVVGRDATLMCRVRNLQTYKVVKENCGYQRVLSGDKVAEHTSELSFVCVSKFAVSSCSPAISETNRSHNSFPWVMCFRCSGEGTECRPANVFGASPGDELSGVLLGAITGQSCPI